LNYCLDIEDLLCPFLFENGRAQYSLIFPLNTRVESSEFEFNQEDQFAVAKQSHVGVRTSIPTLQAPQKWFVENFPV